jgi:hypothetical protein
MDDVKKTYRDVEQGAKKTVREIDGHDVGDDVGNAGDAVRKDLGNAGDKVQHESERAIDDAGGPSTWSKEQVPAGSPE